MPHLAREISRDAASAPTGGAAKAQGADGRGAVHRALGEVEQGVRRIHEASERSRDGCGGLEGQMSGIEAELRHTTAALNSALARPETFLKIGEQMIERVAECGVESQDTPYIRAAQQAAAALGQLLDEALRHGAITLADLFDARYRPLEGSQPAPHLSRFVALADRLLPQVQEKLLTLSDKVVYCIAVDRNGYVACHNRKYKQPQRTGALVWNTANCRNRRNRRIFNDRTGLALGA